MMSRPGNWISSIYGLVVNRLETGVAPTGRPPPPPLPPLPPVRRPALGAGRAYLYEALREVWAKALQGYMIDMPGKMKLQLAATYAAAAAAKVVDLVHKAVGTTGIRDEHRFQRHFRDVHTITQHAYISASRYESGGQYFLGVPIEWPFYGL